jgi:hypothetical protein
LHALKRDCALCQTDRPCHRFLIRRGTRRYTCRIDDTNAIAPLEVSVALVKPVEMQLAWECRLAAGERERAGTTTQQQPQSRICIFPARKTNTLCNPNKQSSGASAATPTSLAGSATPHELTLQLRPRIAAANIPELRWVRALDALAAGRHE